MELRSTEQEIAEMRSRYEDLRRRHELVRHLPPLLDMLDENDMEAPETSTTRGNSAMETLKSLKEIQEQLLGLTTRMDKFRKRQNDKDPITEKPRYGEKTMARVEKALAFYEDLQKAVAVAFGKSSLDTADCTDEKANEESAVIEVLRMAAVKEDEDNARKLREEQKKIEHEEAMKKAQERSVAEEQKLAEEAEQLELQRQRDELVRQAEEARLAQVRAQEELRRADREWESSIRKGPGGVREQLKVLVESTKNDTTAQMASVTALHTIFSQIVSHPEESNFRRIRRDHPRFNQDIGCHPGGKEILIAAGFTLGVIDDVPSFISREPDIEKDMDGWSAWFDLLKKTLEIIEEQMMK